MRRSAAAIRARFTEGAGNEGFVLVEVIVTALLVGLMSLLLVGVIAAGQTSGDQRDRSQADELAQQDQERLRGLSVDQLAGLSQSRPVTLDGQTFTITSTGSYLSSSSGSTSCTTTGAGSADFVKVVSSVDWAANHKDNNVNNSASQRRPPVTEQSVIAPSAGGTLLTRVIDPTGSPISGVRVTAVPAQSGLNSTAAARTDANGCTIFATLQPGDYTVTAALAGYTDANGDSTPSSTVTTTAGNTATANFTMAQAGSLTATFKTTISGTTYTGQQAPSLSYQNPGMTTPPFGNVAPSSSATSITANGLYPFLAVNGSNYSVWAGKCAINQPPTPPTSNLATANVPGGGSASTVVPLPPVILKVFYRTSSSTTAVGPTHIVMYQGCDAGFSSFQQWTAPVRGAGSAGSTDPTGSLGALSLPGQPYGGNYVVCVDRNNFRAYGGISGTLLTNTNFAGTTWNVTIDSTSSANAGVC